MHKIIKFDLSTKKGICSECGPVDIKVRYNTPKKDGSPSVTCRMVAKRHYTTKTGRFLKPEDIIRFNSSSVCECCGKKRKLCIDHDHRTNKLRGFLCRNCNVGLGFFEDSIETLQLAIKYLQKNT